MKRSTGTAIIAVGWLFTGAFTSGSKADVVYLGQRAEVTIVWYACPVEEDLQRLKTPSRGSQEAAASFSKSHHCKILYPGDTGVVANYNVWTADTCLRLKPRADCYWFPEQFVKKEQIVSPARSDQVVKRTFD